MSSSVPTESSTTLTDNITLNDDSPFAYIAAGIRIGSIGGVAVNASDDALTVAVEGEVVGFDGIFADGTSNLFTIGAHGKAWGSIGGLVSHGSDATIFNAGTIFGGAFGVDLEGADHAQLHNSGTITGGRNGESEAGAVTLNALTSGETHRIDNSGLIQTQRAGGLAIAGIGNGVETIVNTGTIKGRISLGLGNDLLDTSRGTVAGAIDMGGGNDTARGSAAADNIVGGSGNDQLSGNAGNDVLRGDAGADLLAGGAGADRFVFLSGHSGITAATEDRITDFSHAQHDVIDLRLFDANRLVASDQVFAFIGTKAFTHHAGELHYAVSGGNAFVSGDADGNGVADFTIRLDHTTALVAADFLL